MRLRLLNFVSRKSFAHLRGFHDDWAKNVTSRVNKFLTIFHENWAKNVTSRVLTCFHYMHIEKNAPPTDINKTNVLTNFHDDWAKIVTSRKNAPPTGGHVFSPIWTICELVRDINKTNVLTNFHDDWRKIVTSRVFTRENCHYIHIEKNAPPTGGHVFSPIWTIFELKTAPPTGGHVFQQTVFELGRDFIGAKLLTKFHEDGTTNVAFSVYEQMLTDGWTDGRSTDKDRSEKLT
ncbi:hypothetical protein DPMN_042549 [Dreissena polymorpha]|uniref:Uncharacterized protein n=1 Tax=Dreissena polymorpha TaxID=45954 RepID=A0A9D4D0L1_DREPO|nr:hypothetical protein DPMN_042549 [Dreissena polymorpha]